MSNAYITYTIEQRVICILSCTTSNVFLAPVLGAMVVEAPVLVALVLQAPVLLTPLLPAPVLPALCPKISTGREKLAPVDWHGWHVFATLKAGSKY